MKKIACTLLMATAFTGMATIKAQTVDEVVNKHLAAMGGVEKLSSIKTVTMEGNMNAQGQDVGITIYKTHQAGQRVEIAVMGMTGYQINTPTQGWAFMPFGGQTSPEAWTDEQVKQSTGSLDLQGAFTNYKEKGTTLELQGTETTEGEACYKIKATSKAGVSTLYYISTKTGYIVKSTSKRTIGGDEKEMTSTFSNYKPTADGFIYAFTAETSNGTINFDKIEVNKPIDPKLYTPN